MSLIKLFWGVIFSATTLLFSSVLAAPILKTDANVVSGKLENGLSYHLYSANDEQKDNHDEKVSIRLYVKIGSLDENDQQKGYAHLVEHLAFRDSRQFTHQDKSDFLENLGLHTNAYTSYNRTVYYVNDRKPTKQRMVKNLKLFRDFADGMFITQSDFEVERKIVLEELRLRLDKKDGIQDRMLEIYDNGQYLVEKRPIGTIEVLNAATRDSVNAFFKKWYQPQHMHLIVTGQIDPKATEAQIKDIFGSMVRKIAIKKPAPIYHLPTGVHFATADDSTDNNISIIIPLPELEQKVTDASSFQNWMNYNIIIGGINNQLRSENDRLNKIVPYIGANYSFEEGRDFLNIFIRHKENERNKAIDFAFKQLASLREFGMRKKQFKTQLLNVKKQAEKPYSPFKHDGKPSKIADNIIINLELGQINISEKDEALQANAFLEHVKIDDINQKLKGILQNRASMIIQSRENVATSEQEAASMLMNNFNAGLTAAIKANIKDDGVLKLADLKLEKGKILSQNLHKATNIHHFKLSNGANAYLLNRKKDDGYVSIRAISKGGQEAIPKRLQPAARLVNSAILASGLGGLTQTALGNYMNARRISQIYPFLTATSQGFVAQIKRSSSLEDALKIIHMGFYMGEVHEGQLEAIKALEAENIAKWYKTENGAFYKQMNAAFLTSGIDYFNILPEQIKAVSKAEIIEVYKLLYSDMSRFNFIIAGDINIDNVKPLLEKYIANIPSQPIKLMMSDIKYKQANVNFRQNTNPKDQSEIFIAYHNRDFDINFNSKSIANITAQVLQKRIYDIMRKERGFTYTVSVFMKAQQNSGAKASLRFNFSVKPDNEKAAIEIVTRAIADLKHKPITRAEFIDKRDKQIENLQKAKLANALYVNLIGGSLVSGYSLDEISQFETVLNAIKYEQVRDDVAKFLEKSYRFESIFSNH